MSIGSNGLKHVSSEDLKALLRALHRGELKTPIARTTLTEVGFFHLGDEVDVLRGLDDAGVRAVLVSVLAERQPRR